MKDDLNVTTTQSAQNPAPGKKPYVTPAYQKETSLYKDTGTTYYYYQTYFY